jgi:adenylylsulfate kinase
MSTKILIMGLPGVGKSTLAVELKEFFESMAMTVDWFNADQVRRQYNDWDFSDSGRIRQAERMRDLASASTAMYVICDFIAPLPAMREIFNADYTIWVDTSVESRYDDTTAAFVPPSKYNFCVDTKDAPKWSQLIVRHILHLKKYQ